MSEVPRPQWVVRSVVLVLVVVMPGLIAALFAPMPD
jgi:hypothetical protein